MLKKIVGAKFAEFESSCRKNDDNPYIFLRRARLIPISKFGDELSLASVFLSALRLVKEFRENFLKEIGMSSGGRIYVYTEVSFPKSSSEHRIDGLILIVKGDEIRDAALLEMKKGSNILEQAQVEAYINIATEWGIDKLITVSNEFVLNAKQTPLKFKIPKAFNLYHFSWTDILTIAQILLFKNKDGNRIADSDQIEILNEVVAYFDSDGSGVCGFNRMKDGWKALGEAIAKESVLEDNDIEEAISSWHQEEKDMALMLSRKLGALVRLENSKGGRTFADTVSESIKKFKEVKQFSSTLSIKDAASDISIVAYADQKKVKMFVSLLAPQDKKTKGQISWLKKDQIEKCKEKIPKEESTILKKALFEELFRNLVIAVCVKHSRAATNIPWQSLEDKIDELKDKDITQFDIAWSRDFGRDFYAPQKFIEEIEKMLLHFYAAIAQNIKSYKPPAPQIKIAEEDIGVENTTE